MKSFQILKQHLSEAELWTKELSFNRWEYIKRQETIDTNLYFIEEGSVRVFFIDDSNEHSLYFGYEGSLVSDLHSFFSETSSTNQIQCINKTRVKVIDKKTFLSYVNRNSSVSDLWIKVLSDLSIWHLEREKDLHINSPLERYNRILSRHPLLFQNVPHKYIASFLRMSPETLSRLQKY